MTDNYLKNYLNRITFLIYISCAPINMWRLSFHKVIQIGLKNLVFYIEFISKSKNRSFFWARADENVYRKNMFTWLIYLEWDTWTINLHFTHKIQLDR